MVTQETVQNLPNSSLRKGKGSASNARQTRAGTKISSAPDRNEVNKDPDMPPGSSRQKKRVSKEMHTKKGRKKGNPLSPVVVDVVFGRVQSVVPDAEELRRKREQDTLRCGRLVRRVGDELIQSRSPKKSTTASENNTSQNDVNLASRYRNEIPSGNTSPIAALIGELLEDFAVRCIVVHIRADLPNAGIVIDQCLICSRLQQPRKECSH